MRIENFITLDIKYYFNHKFEIDIKIKAYFMFF